MQVVLGDADAAFLASAGSLTITTDTDSLFRAAVPFRFDGVNAQVNNQFAQYRAFETKNRLADNIRQRAVRRALGEPVGAAFGALTNLFLTQFNQFAQQQTVFPLVRDWVQANARYEAASLLLDLAIRQGQQLSASQLKTLLPANDDNLLTASRAGALNTLGTYASVLTGQSSQFANRSLQFSNRPVKIVTLARLLEQYGADLTDSERERLATFRERNTARAADTRFLSGLIDRNPDTLNRLIVYESMMQTARPLFDTLALDYLKGYMVAQAVPATTLDLASLSGQHITPQIGNTYLRQSVGEVLGQALRDTAQVRRARTTYLAQEKQPGVNAGFVGEGIYVRTGTNQNGNSLLRAAIDQNRGRVIYVVFWAPGDEPTRQLARDAQRLRDVFSPRELTLLYICPNDADETLWLESIVRNRLAGEHLRLSESQTEAIAISLNLEEPSPVRLITPQGRLQKKDALLPDRFEQLVEQIQALLR